MLEAQVGGYFLDGFACREKAHSLVKPLEFNPEFGIYSHTLDKPAAQILASDVFALGHLRDRVMTLRSERFPIFHTIESPAHL
jgi:hypothetical protein